MRRAWLMLWIRSLWVTGGGLVSYMLSWYCAKVLLAARVETWIDSGRWNSTFIQTRSCVLVSVRSAALRPAIRSFRQKFGLWRRRSWWVCSRRNCLRHRRWLLHEILCHLSAWSDWALTELCLTFLRSMQFWILELRFEGRRWLLVVI